MTKKTLISRINEKLSDQGLKVVRLRGRDAEEYGEYAVIAIPNTADVIGWGPNGPLHSNLTRENVDLDRLARELRVSYRDGVLY